MRPSLPLPDSTPAAPPTRRRRRRTFRLGLTGRVFVGTAGLVVAMLGASLLAATASVRHAGDAAAQRGLEQAVDLVAQFLAGRQRALAGGARVFAQGPYFRALVAAERRSDVLDQAFEGAEQLGADWVFITDGGGRLLAKSDEPAAAGEPLGQVPLVADALRGQVASGFGVSRDSLLFQAVAVPVAVPGSRPAGVLVATQLVNDRLARDVRAATAADVVFYTLDTRGTPRVAAASFARRDEAERALAAVRAAATRVAALGGTGTRTAVAAGELAPDRVRAPVAVGDVRYLVGGGGATTAGGVTVGGFVVLRRLDFERAELAGVQRALIAAGAVGLVLALGAAWLTARRIARPIRALAEATRRAAAGDYRPELVRRAAGLPLDGGHADGAAELDGADHGLDGAHDGPAARRLAAHDEIGALGAAFGALLADLRDRVALDRAALGAVQALGPRGRAGGVPLGRTTPTAGTTLGGTLGAASARAAVDLGRGGTRGTPASNGAPAVRARTLPRAGGGALTPGAVVAGRYRLDAVLGAGGTGVVWRAHDGVLGEDVALKVLRPELAAAGAPAVEAFANELRLARRLSHRNVVRLHDIGSDGDAVFLTMEYVEGASLAALLAARGPLPAPAVVSAAKQLLRALDVAHRQGVVHGDLKPANLLLGAGGVLKVADFGVARLVRAPAAGAVTGVPNAPNIAGAVVGTPAFMAPELLLGGPPTAAADLYAAGVVLQACLTGETPFDDDTPVAFFARKLDPARAVAPAAAPLRLTDAPGAVPAAVAHLLARDPSARPASARAAYALFAELG